MFFYPLVKSSCLTQVWSFDLLLTLTSHVKRKNKSQQCLSLKLISDLKMQRKYEKYRKVQTLKELCLEKIAQKCLISCSIVICLLFSVYLLVY